MAKAKLCHTLSTPLHVQKLHHNIRRSNISKKFIANFLGVRLTTREIECVILLKNERCAIILKNLINSHHSPLVQL